MRIPIHHQAFARGIGLVSAAGVLAGTGMFLGGPAFAATETQTMTCDNGSTITIAVPVTHSSDNGGWGVGKIIDGGSGKLIPTSFTVLANDDTVGRPLLGPEVIQKGRGHANHRQKQITCVQKETDTLENLIAENGDLPGGVPDWAKPTDSVTFSVTLTAVPKG